MSVCVVGGGAAGLITTRHLTNDLNYFEITAFEQGENIGGTWVYTNETSLDSNASLPVQSSMYKYLRTNSPIQLMNLPDFVKLGNYEIPTSSHEEVLQYLHDYTMEFKLEQYYQFNRRVEDISPNSIGEFHVRVQNLENSKTENYVCDAVIVCNGHYTKPHIPLVKGIENFPGRVIHSHNYRYPEDFAGKTVVVLGASSSGIDISEELSNYSTQIYLSHRHKRLGGTLPPNVKEMVGVESVINSTVKFLDGSSVTADVFMYCTGYDYDFPFLNETLGVTLNDNFIFPLYKHVVNVNHPRIGFIGVPSGVLTFPTFHVQAQYYISVLKDITQLPEKYEMLKDAELKTTNRKAHVMKTELWMYIEELASLGHFDSLPFRYNNGFEKWIVFTVQNPWTFKKAKFWVSHDGKNVTLTLKLCCAKKI